jgi:hydrogenase expression/formation protein HypC
MCLAIPGELTELRAGPGGLPFGRVRFGAVSRDVCLVYVPEAQPGDFVIVHVGFAIQRLDREAADRTLSALDEAFEDDALPDRIP